MVFTGHIPAAEHHQHFLRWVVAEAADVEEGIQQDRAATKRRAGWGGAASGWCEAEGDAWHRHNDRALHPDFLTVDQQLPAVVFVQRACCWCLAPEQGREAFTFVAGTVFGAVQLPIDGMAVFLEQHRFHLGGIGFGQPLAIEQDPPLRQRSRRRLERSGQARHLPVVADLQPWLQFSLNQALTQLLPRRRWCTWIWRWPKHLAHQGQKGLGVQGPVGEPLLGPAQPIQQLGPVIQR